MASVKELLADMRSAKLVGTNTNEFDRWLGQRPNYFNTCQEHVSVQSLMTLWMNLQDVGEPDLARKCLDIIKQRISIRRVKFPVVKERQLLAA